MNKALIITICVIAAVIALYPMARATITTVEKQYQGIWIPDNQSSCASLMRIEVYKDSVVLYNNNDRTTFRNLGTCYSCGSGPRGQGIEVQVFPDDILPCPFIIRFNADEKEGVMIIEFPDPKIEKRYPFGKLRFKKCKR